MAERRKFTPIPLTPFMESLGLKKPPLVALDEIREQVRRDLKR